MTPCIFLEKIGLDRNLIFFNSFLFSTFLRKSRFLCCFPQYRVLQTAQLFTKTIPFQSFILQYGLYEKRGTIRPVLQN